ncbi:MAG: 4Fe-4S double cluster binding domain-containing protein [Proteocatella sp.]
MNNEMLFYKDIEYRILNIDNQKDGYREFLKDIKDRRELGINNEYEIKGESLDDFKSVHGFEPRSVVVIFVPYMTQGKYEKALNSNLSAHACSMDYHSIVGGIIENIAADITKKNSGASFFVQCDNGPFNERFFALASGIGKKGINSTVINDKYGSYGFLGLIITDANLDEVKTLKRNCIGCKICIDACPSNAISETGINFNKCISYLTQKKSLSIEEEFLISKQKKIYGCDICQGVCPENKNKKYSNIEDFNLDLLYNIDLDEILNTGNREFKRKYSDRNFTWKGRNVILRNLLIDKKYE